jgi:hypothetical protein
MELVLRTEWYRNRKTISISNKSVTGTVLTENYIITSNNGTEASKHAVIILTDAVKTFFKVRYQLSLQTH